MRRSGHRKGVKMKIFKKASGKKTIKISKREWESIGKKAGWYKKALYTIERVIQEEKEFLNPQDYYFGVGDVYMAPFGSSTSIMFFVKEAYEDAYGGAVSQLSENEKKMFESVRFKLQSQIGDEVYSLNSNYYFPWSFGFMYPGSENLSEAETDEILEDDTRLITPELKQRAENQRNQVIEILSSMGFEHEGDEHVSQYS